MNKILIEKLILILNQFGGPINISYQTKNISNITENLVNFHKNNINNFDMYNISELFSLYAVIDYAIKGLGEDEFNTVTGLDLYKDGYVLLNEIKTKICFNN